MGKNKKVECELCKEVFYSKAHNAKYCRDCRTKVKNQQCAKSYKEKSDNELENIKNTFINMTLDDNYQTYHLTTKGFKEATGITAISVSKMFGGNWLDVLSYFGKKDELLSYVVEEFRSFYLNEYKANIESFYKSHKWITQGLINIISIKYIKEACGFRTVKSSQTLEGLKKNFKEVILKCGQIPFISEFKAITNINLNTYYKYFKTGTYEVILIGLSIDGKEIEKYKQRLSQRLSTNSSAIERSLIYTEDEKEKEFKRVFDEFYDKYNVYPTRRQFERLSKIGEKAYTKTMKMCWNDVREFYGYETTNEKNISEKECLGLISEILDCKYESQKTWNWLVNDRGSNLYVDGYYKEHNLVVEFDGVFHRVSIDHYGGDRKLERQKSNDKYKNNLVNKHGIKMLRIDSRHKWYDKNYLIKRLENLNINYKTNYTQQLSV